LPRRPRLDFSHAEIHIVPSDKASGTQPRAKDIRAKTTMACNVLYSFEQPYVDEVLDFDIIVL